MSLNIGSAANPVPGGNCPAGVDPARRSLGRAIEIAELVDPGFIEKPTDARHVGGGLDANAAFNDAGIENIGRILPPP